MTKSKNTKKRASVDDAVAMIQKFQSLSPERRAEVLAIALAWAAEDARGAQR
jgi:hypothetical protein